MARRLKSSIKIYLILIPLFLSLFLILIWYNSCGLDSGFQSYYLSNVSPQQDDPEIDPLIPTIIFPDLADSPCAAQNQLRESHTLVDTIPIQLNLNNRDLNESHEFFFKCKSSDGSFQDCECKNSDGSFQDCGSLNASDPNVILEIGDNFFTTTSLSTSSPYSQSVIDAYSDTIYYKEHTIEVKLSDNFSSYPYPSNKCTWRTMPQSNLFSFSGTKDVKAARQVDILFVIDHSRNISSIADQFDDSFKGLIDILSDLDWQIAVASMQREEGPPYYFGEFLPIRSSQCSSSDSRTQTNQYILSPFSPCSNPFYCSRDTNDLQNAFIHTIKCPGFTQGFTYGQRGQDGQESQFGIQAAYQILNKYERTIDESQLDQFQRAYAQFFRREATLVMIFLTEEPNCGQRGTNNATTNDPSLCTAQIGSTDCESHFGSSSASDHPLDLIQKVRCIFESDKRFLAYPIIPTTFSDTEHYVDLAKRTQDRTSNSIPPLVRINDRLTRTLATNDQEGRYSASFRQIKEDIIGKTIELKCKPSDEIPESGGELRIPGPTYLFKPKDKRNFQKIIPPSLESHSQTQTPYFSVTMEDGTTHSIEIIEYWKNEEPLNGNNQQLNKVKFIPKGSSNNPLVPILPEGTYKVEYSCSNT